MCEYEHCSGSALDMKVIDPVEVESTKLWKEKGMPEWESDEEWDKNYEEAKARLWYNIEINDTDIYHGRRRKTERMVS